MLILGPAAAFITLTQHTLVLFPTNIACVRLLCPMNSHAFHSCLICIHIGKEFKLQYNLNRSRPFQYGAILGMFLYVNNMYITK